MKQRTFQELMVSKAIHRKHAEKHKANGYPYHRCRRHLLYVSLITKAISNCKR